MLLIFTPFYYFLDSCPPVYQVFNQDWDESFSLFAKPMSLIFHFYSFCRILAAIAVQHSDVYVMPPYYGRIQALEIKNYYILVQSGLWLIHKPSFIALHFSCNCFIVSWLVWGYFIEEGGLLYRIPFNKL